MEYEEIVDVEKVLDEAFDPSRRKSKKQESFERFVTELKRDAPSTIKDSEIDYFLSRYFNILARNFVSGDPLSIPGFIKNCKIRAKKILTKKNKVSKRVDCISQRIIEIKSDQDYEELYDLE